MKNLIKLVIFSLVALLVQLNSLKAQQDKRKSTAFVIKSNILLLNSKPTKFYLDSLLSLEKFDLEQNKYSYLAGLCKSSSLLQKNDRDIQR